MPKTTTLAPITHPRTGEPVAAGAEIVLNDEDYANLRADGTVAASEEEQKAGQVEANAEGTYTARTTRADVGQAEKAEDEPPKKKS